MQRILLTFGFILSLSFYGNVQAQTANNSSELLAEELNILDSDNWSFYSDKENNLYYIDFSQISFNLSNIVVKKDGEVIWKEDVFDLPVDTIYEIDFKQFGSGEFDIELRSFTGVIKKSVNF